MQILYLSYMSIYDYYYYINLILQSSSFIQNAIYANI